MKRVKYHIDKLKNLHDKDLFQLELKNKFSALYNEELELDIESVWTAGKNIINNACETVLGKKTNKKKEWMSDLSWQKVEERRDMKEKTNSAKTRAQKYSAQVKHQELHKEVKKSYRKDKRKYVNQLATEAEQAAYIGDIKTLYNITKTLSRRKTVKTNPVKDKDGKVLTKLNEQMERWNEHFKSVLNRPEPDHPVTLEPGPDLNIKVDNIKKRQIKNALKSLKNGKAAGIDEIPPEALKHGGDEICEFSLQTTE